MYLLKDYHIKEPHGGADSRQLLAKALHHLETHYAKGGQFVPEFPRVLHHLGKDFDTVAPVYDRGPFGFPLTDTTHCSTKHFTLRPISASEKQNVSYNKPLHPAMKIAIWQKKCSIG